jgi:hypothetical protein
MRTTLQILDERLEREQDTTHRPHLGASGVGGECERKTWYSFRHAKAPNFNAETLRKFADGHYSEEVVAEQLEKVVVLSGRQARFQDGHFGGSVDGIIEAGLVEAPNEPHIWEHKCVSDKRWEELQRLRERHSLLNDEGSVLLKWMRTYYEQAQIYMYKLKLDWHYMTVASAGSRRLLSLRTPLDEYYAREIEEKAQRIITTREAPRRVGDFDYWLCRFCDYAGMCHNNEQPDKSCRTCRYSEAVLDGSWKCSFFNKEIDGRGDENDCKEYRRFLDGGPIVE